MKQLLQNMRDGKTTVVEVPTPSPRAGMALVQVSASLVSAGTERMLVEFGEKSLLGKARSRPDLAKQVLDKMKREGIVSTLEAAFNRLDQPMPLGYSSAGTIVALGTHMDGFKTGQRVACACGGYAVHAEYNLVPANLGFDLVLICADTSSNDPVERAGAIPRDRARIVATGAVGLDIPRKLYYEKELNFINSRSYGPGRYDPSYEENGQDYPPGYVRWTDGRNVQTVVELLESWKLHVQSFITHRLPILKAPQAYEVITGKKKEPFLGVLLTYEMGNEKRETSRRITFPTHSAPRTPHVALGVLGAGLYANATLLPLLTQLQD